MKQLHTKGIVLTRTEYGEADRIITFLTPDHGKARVIAKGVRRQKSKLAGGIELFSESDITYVVGRGDLHTLVSTRLITHFGDIAKDLDRTMAGYEMLKIITRVLEDEGGEEYYRLLYESLQVLNNTSAPKTLAGTSFLLHLMRLLGHLPNFSVDAHGAALPPEDQYQFSFDDMAFFVSPAGVFNKNHIKLLRLLSHNPAHALLHVTGLNTYLEDINGLVTQMSRQYMVVL